MAEDSFTRLVGGLESAVAHAEGRSRVMAIHREVAPDGSRDIDVALADGSVIRATISPDRVGPLAAILQEGLLHHRAEGQTAPGMSEVCLVDTHIAQGTKTAELLLSTVQIGQIVLLAPDKALLKLRSEIDRLLALRKLPRGQH
jgi:hypothetical protein